MMEIASRTNDLEKFEAIHSRQVQSADDRSMLEYVGRVAIINVTGPIFRYANLFTRISGATSSQELADAIGEAERSNAEAVVYAFDTPGGDATEIDALADLIANQKKPTVAYVGAMAASAGYWLAAAADQVVITKTGLVGSIGVVATLYDSGEDEKEIEIVSAQSPKKRLKPSSDEGKESVQGLVNKMADVFIESVAKYRGVTAQHVLTEFGQGDVVMGADAVAAGMADRVSDLESILTTFDGAHQ